MNLSKDITLDQLCVTETGLPNIPTLEQTEKLLCLANYILQPIIDIHGSIAIDDAFRSEAVNAKVGGSPTSQHPLGEAVDFYPLSAPLDIVFDWCIDNLKFGQIIKEFKSIVYIHISLVRLGKPNQQALVYKNKIYSPYIKK